MRLNKYWMPVLAYFKANWRTALADNYTETPTLPMERQLAVVENLTRNRLLALAFALRAYRLEHKAYPPTLQELVTAGYLSALPDDPFAPTGTFRYHLDEGKYCLYSIGAAPTWNAHPGRNNNTVWMATPVTLNFGD